MGNKSFTSQLWVLGSLDDPFLGLALSFPTKGVPVREAWDWAAAIHSEWGAHFCLLYPLAPVGAIAIWGLLSGLAGT